MTTLEKRADILIAAFEAYAGENNQYVHTFAEGDEMADEVELDGWFDAVEVLEIYDRLLAEAERK